uniref:ABC-2 type transporter transmembrane domain-containing protein n=1 Tax=Phytophthora ramorum TaxID=164328 RepID=H3HA02_PHYRM
ESCADSVAGNALLRGVSGGERKRVTVGEVLCRDLRHHQGTSHVLGGSVIVALLQPTPKLVEQFDDILMVNEGHMYFEERGFVCPPRVDPADFLIEVTSGRGRQYANGKVPTKDLPVSSEDFNNLFCQSSIYKKTHEAIGKGFNEHQFENAEDFQKAKSVANLARSKEKSEFGLAFVPSTMLLLNRQKLVWLRDPPLLWGKLTEALIIGLVMGMIYFDVSSTYYLRMIFFTIALFQRQAWQQITISFQLRGVFYKQRPRNFFRTMSYAIAETVVQIPVNLSVAFILGTFFYFMSGLTRTFEKYIVFFLVLVCFQHGIGAYMTMLSSLSPSITVGQALAGISVSFFLLFSGNIILADLIPNYWIWMYWFNPLAWALRSNMLSEFSSDRYTPAQSTKFLDSFSISQGTEYVWFGIGILVAYYLFFTTLNGLALHFIRELYKSNRERTLQLAQSDEFVRHSTLNYNPIATGFANQLGQLAEKQQLTYWRNPQYNFMRMFLFPLFAIIFGTTFYQLSTASVKKINSHIGLIYNSMDFIGVINLMTVLEVTCAERAVFYRERMSNYYGPLPYSRARPNSSDDDHNYVGDAERRS